MDEYLKASQTQELRILLDILITILLTGIIGYEREVSNKPAGLKTNMMVGAASALLVSIGRIMVEEYTGHVLVDSLDFDPLRLIQAIVVGVGFIGGGTILKSEKKEKIRYLTSAATILLSAGVGIVVATQKYILAIGLTLIVFAINTLIGKLEHQLQMENKND